MLKLYKRIDGVLNYHEAWIHRSRLLRKGILMLSMFLICSGLSVITTCSAFVIQDEPASSHSETWQQTAALMGLKPVDIEALQKDDLLVTQESFSQYSDAYQYRGVPMFITSDSPARSRRLSTMARSAFRRLATASARTTPPTSGETISSSDGFA